MHKQIYKAQQLLSAGHFDECAKLCKQLIVRQLAPFEARKLLSQATYNLALTRHLYGQLLDEAEHGYQEAFTADPTFADAYNNLAALLAERGKTEESIAVLRKGLKHSPNNLALLESSVKLLQTVGDLQNASTQLLRLAELYPSRGPLYLIREALLVENITPDANYPLAIRDRIAQKLSNIPASGTDIKNPDEFPAAYFPLSYHGICNRDLVVQLAETYLDLAPSLAWQSPHVARPRLKQGKIRVGFASHFFYEHSIGNTSRGLIEQLNKASFEVIVIRIGHSPEDKISRAIDQSANQVIHISTTDLHAAREAIAAQELDILFYEDIGMEPFCYFLAFARLARIQLTSYGHPDTTGIPNIDYFLSSSNYEKADAQRHYSEKLYQIEDIGTLAYYYRPPQPTSLFDKTEFGFASHQKIYACPQTLFKIQPIMDDLFHRILEDDQSASILLIDMVRQPKLRASLEKRFQQSMPAHLTERIKFIPALPYERFLSMLQEADVVLDTLCFNGQNTSLEAFSLGTPVVTLPGELQRERHTYGMYKAMGLEDLVAHDPADYVAKATIWANDAQVRATITGLIQDRCAVLFENRNFVDKCEQWFSSLINNKS